jgi:hypothetical protein
MELANCRATKQVKNDGSEALRRAVVDVGRSNPPVQG